MPAPSLPDRDNDSHHSRDDDREDIRLVNVAPLASGNPHTAVNVTEAHSLESEYSAKALTQAKDRAQGVTTAALTITQVVLLKTVLDAGPDGHRYFILSLTLICISLGLEIIAGFLLIQISQMHKYFRNFGDSCLNDICCTRTTDTDTENPRKKRRVKWCQVLDENEKNTLERYDDWKERIVRYEENFNRAQLDLPMLKLKKEDLDNGVIHIDIRAELVDETRRNKLKTEIEHVKDKIKKAMRDIHAFEIEKFLGEKLAQEVDALEEKRVNKRIAMMLNALNVILYIVCTINAFITAFGIVQPMIENASTRSSETVVDNSIESVTTAS